MPETKESSELPKRFAYQVKFVGGELADRSYWYPIKKGQKIRPYLKFDLWEEFPKGHRILRAKTYYYIPKQVEIPTTLDQIFCYTFDPNFKP